MTYLHYRLTAHAAEQAGLMGVGRAEVVDCILKPSASWPSGEKANVTVARNARLTVPYNHLTGEVITVLWTSTEWMPDRHLPPQEQTDMSGGWINLDAKEAERLLEAWGFIVKEDKGTSKLWTHPTDPEARIVAFSSPGANRANGRSSYKQAAAALDISLHAFLKGPNPRAKIAAETLSTMVKAENAAAGPDPLGLQGAALSQVMDAAMVTVTQNDAMKRQIKALNPTARAAYEAVVNDALTAGEVAVLIERGKSVTNDVLNHLQRIGLVVSRMSFAGELEGRARLLYIAGPAGTEIPRRPTLPAATPVVAVPVTPEEAPVNDTVIQLPTASDPTQPGSHAVIAPPPTVQLFQRTEIKWPTGGIVIQDDEGNLYVARPLVEGK